MRTVSKDGGFSGGGRRGRRSPWPALLIFVLTASFVFVWRHVEADWKAGSAPPVRLHVVPHGNDEEHQRLKFAVRDALRPTVERWMVGADADARAWASFVDELQRTAEAEVRRRQYDEAVQVKVEDGPDGRPAAVKVVIGEGRGANWFCVLVPPLCFADLEPVEKVAAPAEGDGGEGGVRIAWRWLGRLFGDSSVPLKGVGDVDQDDVHSDFADAVPRDGDVGLAGE